MRDKRERRVGSYAKYKGRREVKKRKYERREGKGREGKGREGKGREAKVFLDS